MTETSTRHSLLTKQKHFRDRGNKGIQSNSSKLTGDTNDTPIEVEDAPVIRREESEDDEVNLEDLPEAADDASDSDGLFVGEDAGRRSKRPRATTNDSQLSSAEGSEPRLKRRKDGQEEISTEEQEDDKKKMAMDTTYDGFAIYGRVLCLVVKRIDKRGKGPAGALGGGQATMENWITSTQMPPEDDEVS